MCLANNYHSFPFNAILCVYDQIQLSVLLLLLLFCLFPLTNIFILFTSLSVLTFFFPVFPLIFRLSVFSHLVTCPWSFLYFSSWFSLVFDVLQLLWEDFREFFFCFVSMFNPDIKTESDNNNVYLQHR